MTADESSTSAERSRPGRARVAQLVSRLSHGYEALVEQLRSALWLIPALCVVIAIGLSLLAEAFDRTLSREKPTWFLFSGGSDGARELFSTVASSMLTFAGLVFSITILVLQLASSQFSPRALKTFLQDNTSKLALGVFVGTYVYALLGLRLVHGSGQDRDSFVPAFSVWLTVPLVLVNVGVLIGYLQHIAQSIRVGVVIRRIADETRQALEKRLPEQDGGDAEEELPSPPLGPPVLLIESSRSSGVVTQIDEARLVSLASDANVVLVLRVCTGDFVPKGGVLCEVLSDPCALDVASLRECVVLGRERVLAYDVTFGMRQLVDIAGRALSPSTNDPTTAVQVLDQLHDLLRQIGLRRLPGPHLPSRACLHAVMPRVTWRGYVGLALDEIRVWGGDSLQVRARIDHLLRDLLTSVPSGRKAALLEQLTKLETQQPAWASP